MITLLLAAILMANPTHVYQVTFKDAHTEPQVRQSLGGFNVILLKHDGVASKQKKWEAAIQDAGSTTKVRNKLREVYGVTHVAITK